MPNLLRTDLHFLLLGFHHPIKTAPSIVRQVGLQSIESRLNNLISLRQVSFSVQMLLRSPRCFCSFVEVLDPIAISDFEILQSRDKYFAIITIDPEPRDLSRLTPNFCVGGIRRSRDGEESQTELCFGIWGKEDRELHSAKFGLAKILPWNAEDVNKVGTSKQFSSRCSQ